MKTMTLRLTLTSAATFSGGHSIPGLVDRDIEHDENGFPFLRGRTLKGLLAESAEGLIFALALQNEDQESQGNWRRAKDNLFGRPGHGLDEQGILAVGDARLPEALRGLILAHHAAHAQEFTSAAVLDSLTDVRRQTAMNPDGGPMKNTLRAMRVLLPGVMLEAPLYFQRDPGDDDMALLVATVLDWRRAGTGRNRGRGRLVAELDDEATTLQYFKEFAMILSASEAAS